MSETNATQPKDLKQTDKPAQDESNMGNPSRGAQVAAGDKPPMPEAPPKKPLGEGLKPNACNATE